MARLDEYLRVALEQGASDIHFSAEQPVRIRVDGDLLVLDPTVLSGDQLDHVLLEILSDEEKGKLHRSRNLDRSYRINGLGNFRVNMFHTRAGIASVIRTIPTKIPTIEDLGLPDTLKSLTEEGRGLILVTGPTGSGKSTTLAAMIHHINLHCPYHILTAEDPVEFVHPSLKSLVNQREIGSSCPTFADALKYALREDPDVILVGEMRDLETIGLAMTAAETGHLVFGTLHTRGAAASIDRIIDSFPANQQAMARAMLSESLVAVISQALLKKASGRGRVAAYEIMVVNHAISNLIREGKTFQIESSIQTGRKEGMVLMDQHIKELVAAGSVTIEEAQAYVVNATTLNGLSNKVPAQAAPTPPKESIAVEAEEQATPNMPAPPVHKVAPPAAREIKLEKPLTAAAPPKIPPLPGNMPPMPKKVVTPDLQHHTPPPAAPQPAPPPGGQAPRSLSFRPLDPGAAGKASMPPPAPKPISKMEVTEEKSIAFDPNEGGLREISFRDGNTATEAAGTAVTLPKIPVSPPKKKAG